MSLANEIVGMLDADVLFPMPLCDTLMLLAEERLFSPRWSPQILEEVRRNLVQSKRCTPAQALRRVTVMDDAFPEALVEDYEQLILQLRNHEKDRHVAAAAIHGEVDVIVTRNLRDCPSEALAPWGLRAVGPDRFLLDLLDAAPGNDLRTARCIMRQAHSLKRPSMMHHDVLEAGFAPGEVRSVGLARLTREPTIALVQQVIDGEDVQIEEAVVNYAISSPLDTIFMARVLKEQQQNPKDLKSNAKVREFVRSLYFEVATGAVADDILKDDVKATLQILAALGPAKIEEDAWLAAAAAAIEMDVNRLLRTLEAIENAGILVRRGFHYLIAPEMLRQQILLAALIVRGRPTAFAGRLLTHFPNDAHFLRNLAIVDLESQSNDGPDVFTLVWSDVRAGVIAANSLDRSQFLDKLNGLGFHKPAEVYELVSYLVDHPATNEDTQPLMSAGFGLDHDDVLREIPSVLRYVMRGSHDLVARCVSLLWRLGRDRQVRSHEDPLRMVADLARYEVGASTGLATQIIQAVARLIDAGEADTPQRSLIDRIAPVLAREISMTASRGTKFTIRRTALSVASTRPLRDRTIHLLAATAKGNDGRRAYRAIELLIDLMRDPENQIADPAPEVVADWDRERAMAFDALDDIVDAGAWPLRELQMAYALRF